VGIAPTLLLGLIAGSTILIGLPVGRLRNLSPTVRHLLNAIAVGVLLFLFWDVLVEAWAPIDDALAGIHEGTGGFGPAFGYGALFAGGLAIGLLSMVAYESYLHRAAVRAPCRSRRYPRVRLVLPAGRRRAGWLC
jgi:zinc transporter, ZIP family